MSNENFTEYKSCEMKFKSRNDRNERSPNYLQYINQIYLDFVLRMTKSWTDFFTVFLVVFSVLGLIYWLRKVYKYPIVYSKDLTEIGFEHIPNGKDRDRNITRVQALRRVGSKVPPPYPNGWFAVAESRDVDIGGVLPVDALGENLCVYRGEDGVARTVAAYCPHLGAHLGVGGAVCGSDIQCPFHKWRFDESGQCVFVPGAEKAPKGVSIKSWRTEEADGAIWIWHDAEGREPLWELQNAPECKEWGYRGRNEFYVSAHVQEIPENGADVMHLEAVHSDSVLMELEGRFAFLKKFIGHHIWRATWETNGDHTSTMKLTHDYDILGLKLMHTDINVTQIGPGHVRLRMETPLGPALISQTVTPMGPLLQKVVNRFYSPTYNAPIARIFVVQEGKMIERDIKIWNSKVFVSAPAYVKADKTIRAFRNWFSQFYSENSISFKDSWRNNLNW